MTTSTTAPPQLTIQPRALADALAAVKPAVGTRSAIEALSGVRIYVEDGAAYIAASDMEVSVRRRLPAIIHDDVDVLVSHAEAQKAAKLFGKRDSVGLAATDGDGPSANLVVSDGTRTVTLRGLRVEDYPLVPFFAMGEVVLDAPGPELAAVIERAWRFTSKDETRPVLTGICLDRTGSEPRLVGTDSYRLAILACPGEALGDIPAEKAGHLNIVGRGLALARKAIASAERATIGHLDPCVIVSAGDEVWRIRTIAGQYPNCRQLVPDDQAFEVKVDIPIGELAAGCDVAKAFCDKNAPVRLSVNGVVKLSGHVPDGPSFEEVLPGSTYRGTIDDEFEIGFNPEFLADIPKVHVNDTARLGLITPLRPALFIDGDDRYLLMPIALKR